ncbi:NADH:flavin oxidoreductase / NADH oxidase [Pollutimonas nitritireducens]|uniref:NADH:flavin oxidoreductase / NADH oxidase n=1 Tax=Pollutimonas nitritireducens TaxID=2045209 RepID=A0A2N4UB58_9BURK|nr:NADH:flavin oxidoreductase/NADH oxidase [Pollutimonas nitritireducens]PLC52259.1 NADH:flavin oxidoreductase / NADH oxidase [Pollutimonas nitritireducens]
MLVLKDSDSKTVDTAEKPALLQPFTMRSVVLKNRIMVSPMSMYSTENGCVRDFHLVHLGRFALGGAAMVMMEATAVTETGRGTHGCTGIWTDEQLPGLKRITEFLRTHGSVAGIQLGHSGPKGASQRPWHGFGTIDESDASLRGELPWALVSSTDQPFDQGWQVPAALSAADMDALVEDFRAAASRAAKAGFQVIELHCAHGYLLHSFLSPLVNTRDDEYGGSLQNRMRFPLRVFDAVRAAFPSELPVMVRISAVDGIDVGWSIEDSIKFAAELADHGADAIACSSGGVRLERGQVLVSRNPGFQVPFANELRNKAGIPTVAVGMLLSAQQANEIVKQGKADLVALGREMLANPNWAAQAAVDLKGESGWDDWPEVFGWWLKRRARQLARR